MVRALDSCCAEIDSEDEVACSGLPSAAIPEEDTKIMHMEAYLDELMYERHAWGCCRPL